jgi:Spy/CpxP family protein refolding chaperone
LKKNMRTRISIVVICCAMATAFLAAHQGTQGGARIEDSKQAKSQSHSPRPPSRWWTYERYRQELKLTAEQSAELEKIFQASMARLKEDKEAFERAQTDFRQLMERSSASERELLKAAERLEMARFSMAKERTMMLVRMHSVLTADQRRGLEAIAKRSDNDRSRQK